MTQFIWVGLALGLTAALVFAFIGGRRRVAAAVVSLGFLLAAVLLAFFLPDEPPFGCSETGSAVAAAQVTCAMLCATAAGASLGASIRARTPSTIVISVLLGGLALIVVWAPYVCSLAT